VASFVETLLKQRHAELWGLHSVQSNPIQCKQSTVPVQ
jgi:hypothetical protein